MLHAVSLFGFLYGLWLALSGHYTSFYLAIGAVCVSLVVWIAIRMDVVDHEGHPVHMSYRAPIYWGWLGLQIIIWALRVSRQVLSPKIDIDPVFNTVQSSQRTELGKVIYANSITLTPGTLSTAVWPDKIEVHALNKDAFDDLNSGGMDKRVSNLEGKKGGSLPEAD